MRPARGGSGALTGGVEAQDGGARGRRRHRHGDLAIQPARPPQRRVERIGPVGGGNDR